MHELGLAENTLMLALQQANLAGAQKICSMTLRVGVLSGVDDEALRYALEIVVKDTLAAEASIHVETVAAVCYCGVCAEEFEATELSYVCPRCGQVSADLIKGRELDLISMEVE